VLLAFALSLGPGCKRAFYRRMADCETYSVLGERVVDSGSELVAGGYELEPGAASRLADPTPPDFPPRPAA